MRENDIEIRFATNEEGHIVRDLLMQDDYDDIEDLNWNNIYPYWLIAVYQDKIIGCIELLIGYPVGIMEFMAIDKTISQMQRALVSKRLVKNGFAAHSKAGVSATMACVPFHLKGWKKILKRKWNAVVISSGNIILKKLVSTNG